VRNDSNADAGGFAMVLSEEVIGEFWLGWPMSGHYLSIFEWWLESQPSLILLLDGFDRFSFVLALTRT
jgi:hypothetical protein